MGVYFKDMKMPKNCAGCEFHGRMDDPIVAQHWCKKTGENILTPYNGRGKNCPLGDVPTPHGRLGDLDRLEQMFADIDNAPYSGFDGTEPFYSAEDAAQIIRLAPTIIPESWEGE